MKRFTSTVSVIFLLQLIPLNVYTQDTIPREPSYKNSITLDVGRIIWNEARFGYERQVFDIQCWRVIVGFQYPTSGTFENKSPYVEYGYEPYYNRVSTGIYLGTGISCYLKEGDDRYIALEAYYNYAFFNHKYFINNGGPSSSYSKTLESMRQSKAGVKILFGKKFRGLSIGKFAHEVDMFAGLGVQYRLRDIIKEAYYDYEGILRPYDPLALRQHEKVYPTLHVGFLVGIPFGQIY